MVLQQRSAVFHLLLALASVGLFVGLLPVMGMTAAQGAFAILALTGLTPLLFRRRGAVEDERDRLIQLKSLQITFGILWILMIGTVWTLYYLYAGAGAVPAAFFPLIGWMVWAAFLGCQSAALLVLYRRY